MPARLGRVALDVALYGRRIRFADGLREFRRLRRLHAHERRALFPVLEPDLDAVGRVRIDHDAAVLPNAADGCEAVRVGARTGNESGLGDLPEIRGAGQIEGALALQRLPQLAQRLRVAADEVVGVALEVGGFRDVHRRTAGRVDFRRLAHAVAAGAEEFVENVILVGRDDELPDRHAHLPRDVPGVDVAEIARGHRKGNRFAVATRHGEIRLEVIHDLRRDSGPVDRVDRADAVPRLETDVARDRLDDVLAVVEDAADGDIEDIGVLQRVHLRRLERAHAAMRREHEDLYVLLAAQRVLGRRSGVPGGG